MLHSERLGSTTIQNTWRSLFQSQSSRTLTQNEKPLFRKHLAKQPIDDRLKSRFRLFRRKRRSPTTDQGRLSRHLRFNSVRELVSQATPPAGSRTQTWLSTFSFDGTVIPKHLSQAEFPAGDVTGPTSPSRLLRMRTAEDKRRVEAVLTTPISSLAAYISPDMMDMIKKSPFIKHGEDAVVFRSHVHRTRGQNRLQCYRILSRFLRNVASEILYREQRIAADEMMYRAEGAIDDPESVTLSGAESKAMAWNLKQPFRLQLRRLRKLAEKEAISGAENFKKPFELRLRQLREMAEREAVSGAENFKKPFGLRLRQLREMAERERSRMLPCHLLKGEKSEDGNYRPSGKHVAPITPIL